MKLFSVRLLLAITFVSQLAAQSHHPSANFSADVPIRIMPVQGKVFMIVIGDADGVNVTAQVGDDGVLLVDAGPSTVTPDLLKAIKDRFEKPIRFLINTHIHPDHTGGNAAIVAGMKSTGGPGLDGGIAIIASESAANRMSGTEGHDDLAPEPAWPTSMVFGKRKEMFFNGEPIEILYWPSHTDGDLMVWFRSSDVVSTGDAFILRNYPVIDSKRGGSLTGLIEASRWLVDTAVAEYNGEGGTKIIPGHGELCNETEVTEYMIMLSIIRDRVRDLVKKGMTLAQVKAARPTLDYDGAYGGTKTFWTPEMFIDAVFHEITAEGGK